MLKWNNLSIAARIILFTGCFVGSFCLALLYLKVSISLNTETSREQSKLVTQQIRSMEEQSLLLESQALYQDQFETLDSFRRDYAQMRYWLSDLAVSWLNDSESSAELLSDRLTEKLNKLRDIDSERTNTIERDIEDYYDKMIEAVDAYVDENRVLGNSRLSEGRLIAVAIDSDLQVMVDKIVIKLDSISEEVKQGGTEVSLLAGGVKKSAEKIVGVNERLSLLTIVALILCLVSGVIFCIVLKNNIHTPIKTLLAALTHIQMNSDLLYRVKIGRKDELGQTSIALNTMMEHFLNIVRNVSSSTDELRDVSNETSRIMDDARKGVLSQQLATDQVASAITQMVVSVQEVARHATQAATAATEANDLAQKGQSKVQSMVTQMNALSVNIEQAKNAIGKVSDDSSNIAKVLDVIRGVSDQTNLLALNAAIEAARAGEAGRGFAVVADEVRTLAQTTQASTTEIQDMITRFQDGIHNAVSVIEQGVAAMSGTVDNAQEAGDTLALITSAIEEITDLNYQIATATEQQHAVAEDINRNIIDISNIGEHTTDGVNKTVDSSMNQKKCTENLAELVGQFKVN